MTSNHSWHHALRMPAAFDRGPVRGVLHWALPWAPNGFRCVFSQPLYFSEIATKRRLNALESPSMGHRGPDSARCWIDSP